MMSDVMKLLLELRGKLQFFEGKYVTVEKPEDIADIEQIDVKKDIYNIDLLLSTERTIPVSVEPIDDVVNQLLTISHTHKTLRRKLLNYIVDNLEYATDDIRRAVHKNSHVNFDDRKIISYVERIKLELLKRDKIRRQ
jgi:hypothetical protein